jgi:hypothetical protein
MIFRPLVVRVLLVAVVVGAAFECAAGQVRQGARYFVRPEGLSCDTETAVETRVLYEYGAVYLSKAVKFPLKCRMTKAETDEYTKAMETPVNRLDLAELYLHPDAKAALDKAIKQLGGYLKLVRNCNSPDVETDCTNGVNRDAALRTYEQAQKNWDDHNRRNLSEDALVADTGRSKPFIFSYAVPGGSQHHLGLAIDVINGTSGQPVCKRKRIEALESNGWFRTIRGDPYHFTYLGYKVWELPSIGLKHVACAEPKDNVKKIAYDYWVPNVPATLYKPYTGWACKPIL